MKPSNFNGNALQVFREILPFRESNRENVFVVANYRELFLLFNK